MQHAAWLVLVLGSGAAAAACGAEVRPAAPSRTTIARESGLSRDAVDDVIGAHLPAVTACYERFAQAEGRPVGVVRFGWHIDATGAVDNVALVSTSLSSAAIEACIAEDIARWHFPAAARETEVAAHPFSF